MRQTRVTGSPRFSGICSPWRADLHSSAMYIMHFLAFPMLGSEGLLLLGERKRSMQDVDRKQRRASMW
jgi:hypothetical protein